MKQHVAHRTVFLRPVFGLLLVLTLGLAACGGSGDNESGNSADDTSGKQPTQSPADIEFTPKDGATDVSPQDDIKVSTADGKIEKVALKNEDGKKVDGELADDGKSWEASEPLGYGKKYTWSGTVLDDKQKTPIEGSFGVVRPDSTNHAQFNVGDDQTYGTAEPITLDFEQPVKDKAAAEKALSVETDNSTDGSWAWFDNDTSVHWRPKDYWEPHTDVQVKADLYGVDLGGGAWGENDINVDFSIGDQHVLKGNTKQHRLKLYKNGEQIADYPVSYGANSDPRRVTRSGPHVIMAMHKKFSMSNAQFDYENVEVPWAIRISNNGEFIHGYAPTIGVQGSENVSHGCVNMDPKDAKKVMDFAQIGDPVEITGSDQKLGPSDGAYYDWTVSWSDWKDLSALKG